MTKLTALDWIVIAVYFLILLAVVVVEMRRQKTATDYFLAGRNAGFFLIGSSIFATNIGSEHIVGLAGQGASTGLAVAHYELHAWIVVLLAWVFVPFYYQAQEFTMPEFTFPDVKMPAFGTPGMPKVTIQQMPAFRELPGRPTGR